MKKLILLMLVIGATTALQAQAPAKTEGPDTIAIVLMPEIDFNWSLSQSRIVRDAKFDKLKANKKNIKEYLYAMFTDEAPMDFKVCFKEGIVKRGDIAFNLFDALFNLPYNAVFGQRFDLIYPPCTVPAGIYEYVEANRKTLADQIRSYYEQSKK